jgi:hypothetical protein
VKALRGAVLGWLVMTSVWAQDPGSDPRFEDFPIGGTFNSKPSPPKLVEKRDRLFRTRIREGAAKGPNFARRYTIVEWGCGSGCVSFALADAEVGTLFRPPFRDLGWGMPLMEYEGRYAPNRDGFMPLSYRLDSSLLVVRGCPEDENCGTYFYEWKAPRFRLIRKVAAVPIR